MDVRACRILVVDDDVAMLGFIRQVLGRCTPHCVVTTSDPRDALARLNEDLVDVLLTDIQMPHLTGTELAKAARVTRAGLKIVLMTGDPAAAPSVQDAVHQEILYKPCQ